MRIVCPVLAFVFALGLASPGGHAQTASRDFFAFVLLAEGSDGRPVPMVRSVAERATACPVLRSTAGGVSTAMTPRRRPPGGHFDAVTVCEALYPVGEAASVFLGDRRIDLPNVLLDTPRRVVLIGDSGCRGPTEAEPPLPPKMPFPMGRDVLQWRMFQSWRARPWHRSPIRR